MSRDYLAILANPVVSEDEATKAKSDGDKIKDLFRKLVNHSIWVYYPKGTKRQPLSSELPFGTKVVYHRQKKVVDFTNILVGRIYGSAPSDVDIIVPVAYYKLAAREAGVSYGAQDFARLTDGKSTRATILPSSLNSYTTRVSRQVRVIQFPLSGLEEFFPVKSLKSLLPSDLAEKLFK